MYESCTPTSKEEIGIPTSALARLSCSSGLFGLWGHASHAARNSATSEKACAAKLNRGIRRAQELMAPALKAKAKEAKGFGQVWLGHISSMAAALCTGQ